MGYPAHRLALWLALSTAALGDPAFAARAKLDETARDRAAADALFTNGVVLHLRLEIPKEGINSLRREPRKYVVATLREGETLVYSNVFVHLKGSAGSFRQVDDKAGFTLELATVDAKARFHGLKRFHLNNSVQDPTYLSELICNELYRAAFVPAPRAAHAFVELNGRKLGLYVVKESFDKEFLSLFFKDPRGNLYGQPGGGDINQALERMAGRGPVTRADLKALVEAAQEPEAERRGDRLQQRLDVDRFVSFMALEVMLCHWDGYTFAQHNYRVYHDPDTDRMVFFPHDMDQMLGDPNVPITPGVNGMVAQAVLKTPQTRRLYLARFGAIFTNLFVVETLSNRVNQLVAQMQPALKAQNPNFAREFENNARGLKDRIVNRAQALRRQLSLPPPRPLKFEHNVARLDGWRKENERGDAQLDPVKDPEGKATLWIRAKDQTTGSWRAKVQLAVGRYRFEGSARCAGLMPIPDDKKGDGAGLRISGSLEPRRNKLTRDAPWQKLEYEFEVAPPGEEVELVCELRAQKGEVWFDLNSLQLVRKP